MMRETDHEAVINTYHLFEQQALETPTLAALKFDVHTLSYQQLLRRVAIIRESIANQNVQQPIVAISTERTPDIIAGLLAILQSGKAYLPLDAHLPTERLKQLIADSGVTYCIATGATAALYRTLGLHVIVPESLSEITTITEYSPVTPTLAYILYTSGSTGKPKGVCMGHKSLANLLQWQEKNSSSGPGFRTLQFAPLTFDVSFQEIFATLTTGGTLVLASDEVRLDPALLLSFIDEQQINRIFLPFVALQYLLQAASETGKYPPSLREVVTAGEQLKVTPQCRAFFAALPEARLFNQYGPTECHVVTQLKLAGDPATWAALPSIGLAIDQTEIILLDENMAPATPDSTGELCIAGVSLADGYLNQPELTAQKFPIWIDGNGANKRIYRTGDVAKWLPNGELEFLGRQDEQVKIRGYRVELGEVETLLGQQPDISQAVVVTSKDWEQDARLIAYLVSANGQNGNTAALRTALATQLPDYMIPAAYVWLRELPKTSSGKVDKKALPRPGNNRPVLNVWYETPTSPTEQRIAQLWATLLQLDKVGINDNFFELGGNSLLAVKTVATISQQYGYKLPITRLYQSPTVKGIAAYLDGSNSQILAKAALARIKDKPDDIAIIAMAGKFPGANNISEYWELLKNGRETISFFSPEELDASISKTLITDPAYVSARGILPDAGHFDASFFGITPRQATLMDPQHRVFLEIAYQALETSGYLPSRHQHIIGVFAGTGNNSYYLNNIINNQEAVEQLGGFQVMTQNEKDYIATRVAYTLDLKGPAISVHSGCSTSLLAVAQAVQSIRAGQCELALAGGVAITAPIKSGHIYLEGAMLSRDGHCRPFDADAHGTVFSDGAGVVLLKSKAAAMRDGDTIIALIKGVGINNDGSGKGNFSAPSADGQAGAIAMALADAAFDPTTVSYVEAHGTATPLGDPIEIDGLKMAMGQSASSAYCAIGSVKGNIGHLTAAAGVAGLIKTVLAIHHRQLPPSINFATANPHLGLEGSPFYVNSNLTDWNPAGKRRAGVSSFGVGGTNVHLSLEEPETTKAEPPFARPLQLLTFSAKTLKNRESFARQLASFMDKTANASFTSVTCNLHLTRPDYAARRFVIASTASNANYKLTHFSVQDGQSAIIRELPSGIVFNFSYTQLGEHISKQLYDGEPVYKQAVDHCGTILGSTATGVLQHLLQKSTAQALPIAGIPTSFISSYALYMLWGHWGIKPAAVVGSGIGALLAAVASGVLPLHTALEIAAQYHARPDGTNWQEWLGKAALHPMQVPVASVVTGAWLAPSESTEAGTWIAMVQQQDNHDAALATASGDGKRLLLHCCTSQTDSDTTPITAGKFLAIVGGNGKTTDGYHDLLNAVGQLWLHGAPLNWAAFHGTANSGNLNLPNYAFDKKLYWLNPAPVVASAPNATPPASDLTIPTKPANDDASDQLATRIRKVLEEASGLELKTADLNSTFIELGLDSLMLTQVALNLKKEFRTAITFRQLNEQHNTISLLASYIASSAQRLQQNTASSANTKSGIILSAEELAELKKPFGAGARIEKQSSGLSDTQQSFLDALTIRYNEKTKSSKHYTQQHRQQMADPRVVSGFRPLTKEIVYPIVVDKSKGCRLWDLDGNEYIDALNGFGSSMLGFQHPAVVAAVKEQLEHGYEIGPQHHLAGTVSSLICEFTGADRAALCNTGSEAVLGAMRIARTVTGRTKIAAFSGSYHGINDEVIVRGTKALKTFPGAPGIMSEAVQNMLILDYGTEDTLELIRIHGHELAAVLVEPVQSRRPDFQPVAFLKSLRKLATEMGIVLIFDEVITGFRMHPGGAQAMFGISADLGTYGKVVAGGMPIGVIAGKKEFMDALDGGFWEYGDGSVPEAGVTYFAGTFVRHPLALAAAKASLEYMKQVGPALQKGLNNKTARLAAALNATCVQKSIPLYAPHFGSLWKIKYKEDVPYGELLFTLMREKGIHIWDIFPCFITEAHTDADIDRIIEVFIESADELIAAGFLTASPKEATIRPKKMDSHHPPVPGARIGRDPDGRPAWYIADPEKPGKYLQLT